MKKFASYLTILFVAVALVTGCKKDDDDSSVAPKGGISAKINGDSWKSENTTSSNAFGIISLGAATSDGKIISLNCGDSVATYNLSDTIAFNFNGASYTVGSTDYDAVRGTIIVTENNATDGTISGTFDFVAKNGTDSVVVTEGSFNQVEY